MDEDTEYIKLPVEERCVHKLWKARVHGYEEATKLFRRIDDEKSQEWNKYLGLIKKFAGDSNVAAQEKGLEATLAYVENAGVAGKTVGEVMSVIVNKCLGSPKSKIKDLGMQISLMYVEIGKQEPVIEELLKGSEHKNPKIAAACVVTVTQCLKEFGCKIVNLKNVMKKIPTLLEDRDGKVREETKVLTVEIFRWIGPVLKTQLTNLKPVQLQELEAEFDKVKDEKPLVTRYLRSQQVKQSKLASEEAVDENADDEDNIDGNQLVEVDPYDLLNPVDILSKLPKDFYDKLEEKKWQERKEALDLLEKLLNEAPKLESGDYGDLIRALKKIITKDANVIVVGAAAKCMALLGAGLKKRFQPYVGNLLSPLLEKFKEKKQNVVVPLREAVDAVFQSTTLEQIQDDVISAMENKNPSVRVETVAFLTRCFTKCTPIVLNKKLLKAFCTALLKTLNESDPVVRDNSAAAIGTAWKVVGEKAIMPYLSDIDNIKLTKIKEASEKAVIVAKMPRSPKKAANNIDGPSKRSDKPKAGSSKPKPVTRKTITVSKSGAAVGGMKKAQSVSSLATNSSRTPKVSKPPPERELTDDEIDEKCAEMFPGNIVSEFGDSNWKIRLSALEQFQQILTGLKSTEVTSQLLIRLLSKKPGFKENNLQALKVKLDCLKYVSKTFPLTSTGISFCLNDVVTLLGDSKSNAASSEILMLFSESVGLDYIYNEMISFALQHKNPKIQVETLMWISKAILEFGFTLPPKPLTNVAKKSLASSNPLIRSAAISLLGTMHMYMGPQLTALLDNEKPALLNQIVDKHRGEKPPAPVRGKEKCSPESDVSPSSEDFNQDLSPNMEDSDSRINIANRITPSLIDELSHRDWKIRMEAITKLQDIVNDAKYITNDLGDVTRAIAQRLTDSNVKLAMAAVSLCESIAIAMGPSCKIYIRDFTPGLWQCVGDSKNYLRSAALKCVNTWSDVCGAREFFEGEIIASALKTGTPALRTELWSWLAKRLPDAKGVSKEELLACLPHLYSNLEDRNSDVRKNTNDAVLPIMTHIGYQPMANAAEKLKPASASAIKPILDKNRCYLPETAPPPPPLRTAKGKGSADRNSVVLKNGTATIVKPSFAAARNRPVIEPLKKKKDEDSDSAPLLKVNNIKMQRNLDEQKLRILKWNFTSPREEFVEQLKEQMMTAGVNKTLVLNMFHADFKYHLRAIDALSEDLVNNTEATVSNLDLILKWLTLRFFDTNPSVLIRGLEYVHTLFRVLAEQGYTMLEFEANGFIPYLIIKTGDPKDTVRNVVKDIFDQLCRIFSFSRIFGFTMEGLKSKNARQRTGCLELLSRLIEDYGMTAFQPAPNQALKEIAKQISDRDNSVRNAALNCIVIAYFTGGDKVRQMIGNISDKDMTLLEERIKRAMKSKQRIPVATVRPTISPHKRSSQHEPMQRSREDLVSPDNDDDVSDNDDDDDVMEEGREESPQMEEQQNIIETPPRGSSSGSDSRSYGAFKARLMNCTYTGSLSSGSNDYSPISQHARSGLQMEGVGSTIPQRKRVFGLDKDVVVALDATRIYHPKPDLDEYETEYFQESVTSASSVTSVRPQSACYNTPPKFPDKPKDLESWISVISSGNLEDAIKALEEIECALHSEEKKTELVSLADHLLTHLCKQLTNLSKSTEPDLAKCYRLIFSILMKVYNYPPICEKVSDALIQQVLSDLLYLLVEKHLENLDTTKMFIKVVNNLVLRILDRSDHTTVICALLQMLYDSVANEGTHQHYQELIMKCIWKAVKYIPDWDPSLDYAKILTEIHRFFVDFPSNWWKKHAPDTPLRTYKTIVHTMVKARGSYVLTVANSIPGITQDSEIISYIARLLRHLQLEENKETKMEENVQEKIKYYVPRELKTELTNILSAIGNTNETQLGLNMLYEFKQNHPEIDITPFLATSSKFFQDYVKRGLKSIEDKKLRNVDNTYDTDKYAEINRGYSGEKEDSSQFVVSEKNLSEAAESAIQDYYKKRLRVLQMEGGCVSEETQHSSSSASRDPFTTGIISEAGAPEIIPVVKTSPSRAVPNSGSDGGRSIELLKYRLSMVRQSKT